MKTKEENCHWIFGRLYIIRDATNSTPKRIMIHHTDPAKPFVLKFYLIKNAVAAC
jgi:hypothetical protein